MSVVDLTLKAAFGKPAETREIASDYLTFRVHRFERKTETEPVHMFVTAGMSDERMKVPREAGAARARAELVFYASDAEPEYWAWLSWLAQFPFIDSTWLGFGHTVDNTKPLFAGSELRYFLFLETLVLGDRTLFETIKIESDPVNFLWVVPISTKEKELKAGKGVGALLDVLDAKRHPWLFSGDRKSYL